MVTRDPRPNLRLRRDSARAPLARAVEGDLQAVRAGTALVPERNLEEPLIDHSGIAFAGLRVYGKIKEIKIHRSKSDATWV